MSQIVERVCKITLFFPLVGSKPSLMNQLTVPHPDGFSGAYRTVLKLVSGWFNDIYTLTPSFPIWKQKFQNIQYLMHLQK